MKDKRAGIILIILAAFALTGCATTSKQTPESIAYKSLVTLKEATVTAAAVGDRLCDQKTLKPEQCQKIAEYYRLAGPAYDAAADALIIAIKTGDAKGWQKFQVAQSEFLLRYSSFMAVAGEFGLLPEGTVTK